MSGNMPKAKNVETKPIEPELTAMIVSLAPAGTLRRTVLVLFCLGLRIGELLAPPSRSAPGTRGPAP
ncbi:MAG TPA: hypothetical protein VKV27_15715 [Solirubrobacteraceae bacterium]|nr:hypothetical protein [Solirubrobacteraceae bacterium]